MTGWKKALVIVTNDGRKRDGSKWLGCVLAGKRVFSGGNAQRTLEHRRQVPTSSGFQVCFITPSCFTFVHHCVFTFFFHNREIAPCSLKECHERTITWATVLNESKAVARAIMVAPSEKVLISAREGSIRWVECVLGALFSGGVPTHINPSCSYAQFKQCIETCQTRWLFIEDKLVC